MSDTAAKPRVPRQTQERAAGPGAASGKQGGGAGADSAADVVPAKKSTKKLIIIAVVLLAVIGGAAYFFLLAPKKSTAVAKPVAGTVEALDSTSVNLAGGHYLRVGVALQLTTTASSGEGSDGPDGSKAQDLIISTFSGQSQTALADATTREKLKGQLRDRIIKAYGADQVMDIYFTEFVTQ